MNAVYYKQLKILEANLNDNGKLVEKQGRKATGSKAPLASYDSLATETGFLC